MVELGVGFFFSKGLTSLNRPRQGGGNSCGSVSHAASHPQTEERDELGRERDGGRKTERGLGGETAEMNTKKQREEKKKAGHTTGTESRAPKHQRLLGARNEGARQ